MAVTELCAHAFSTEQQLTEEQIYNQKPQAQYNEKQTRSFWRKVKDNLPVLGAMIAASVAIVTMSFNNHTTLRHQQDTQFDEALRRLGDRDNCIVRAGAAAFLAGMAQRQPRYFHSAFVQLFSGLILERSSLTARLDPHLVQRPYRDESRQGSQILAMLNTTFSRSLTQAFIGLCAVRGAGAIRVSQTSFEK